jgi:hypothetical protein
VRKKVISAILFVFILIGYFIYVSFTRPIKWYDEQGSQIVKEIQNKYSIPIDGMSERPGIYHKGWAYFDWGKWKTGSLITIYGVKNTYTQGRIINNIKHILEDNNFNNVKVIFYDESRYEKRGSVTTRLPSSELRIIIIKK